MRNSLQWPLTTPLFLGPGSSAHAFQRQEFHFGGLAALPSPSQNQCSMVKKQIGSLCNFMATQPAARPNERLDARLNTKPRAQPEKRLDARLDTQPEAQSHKRLDAPGHSLWSGLRSNLAVGWTFSWNLSPI